RILQHGRVIAAPHFAPQLVVAHVPGDPDDLVDLVHRVRLREALADGVLVGKVEARHALVDHRHPQGAGAVLRPDAAAEHDGNADDLEVAGAHAVGGDLVGGVGDLRPA